MAKIFYESDCDLSLLYGKIVTIILYGSQGHAHTLKLKESGVDKKYFQPIISKSKKILGYTFITDNILPQKSYIDENYKFKNQCEKCERINMTENENIFYFIPKRITEEGIKNLKDVNKTYEFYDEYREIIISKKVAQIIKENVPYAKFYPVILDNRN